VSCGLFSLPLLAKSLDLGQKSVEVGAAIEPTVGHNGADLLCVRNVLNGIGLEQDEVRKLAWLHCPQRIGDSQDARGVNRQCGGPEVA